MKHWAEFYRLETRPYANVWNAAIGDRSIIRLDGRLSSANRHAIAAAECRKRGYDGYHLTRGDNLLNTFNLTGCVVPVSEKARKELRHA